MNGIEHVKKIQIDSRLALVSEVAASFSNYCHELEFNEQFCFQVELCAVEAINNAIIHAYQNQPGNQINIEWWLDSKRLFIKVTDSGIRMEKIPEDTLVAPEAESGRGWFIMRQWMDKVDYISNEQFNSVILQKTI